MIWAALSWLGAAVAILSYLSALRVWRRINARTAEISARIDALVNTDKAWEKTAMAAAAVKMRATVEERDREISRLQYELALARGEVVEGISLEERGRE